MMLVGTLCCDWQVILSVLATASNIHWKDGKRASAAGDVMAGTVQRCAEICHWAAENTQGGFMFICFSTSKWAVICMWLAVYIYLLSEIVQ